MTYLPVFQCLFAGCTVENVVLDLVMAAQILLMVSVAHVCIATRDLFYYECANKFQRDACRMGQYSRGDLGIE